MHKSHRITALFILCFRRVVSGICRLGLPRSPTLFRSFERQPERPLLPAGKLNQRAYGDQPRHLSQTYVAGNVEIRADEATRQALIEARQRYLGQRGPDTARLLLAAASASQPKIQAGTPIDSTTPPEDPHIIHMRSFEQGTSEDQAIIGIDR